MSAPACNIYKQHNIFVEESVYSMRKFHINERVYLSAALYKDSIPGCHKVSSHIHGNTFKRVPGGYTERGEVEALLEGLDGSETPLLVYSLSKSGCMFTSRGTILTTCRLLTPLEIDSLLHSLMLSPC